MRKTVCYCGINLYCVVPYLMNTIVQVRWEVLLLAAGFVGRDGLSGDVSVHHPKEQIYLFGNTPIALQSCDYIFDHPKV